MSTLFTRLGEMINATNTSVVPKNEVDSLMLAALDKYVTSAAGEVTNISDADHNKLLKLYRYFMFTVPSLTGMDPSEKKLRELFALRVYLF